MDGERVMLPGVDPLRVGVIGCGAILYFSWLARFRIMTTRDREAG